MTIYFQFHKTDPMAFDVLQINEDSNEVTLAGVVCTDTNGVWTFARFLEGGGATATRYPDTDLLSVLQLVYTLLGGMW